MFVCVCVCVCVCMGSQCYPCKVYCLLKHKFCLNFDVVFPVSFLVFSSTVLKLSKQHESNICWTLGELAAFVCVCMYVLKVRVHVNPQH